MMITCTPFETTMVLLRYPEPSPVKRVARVACPTRTTRTGPTGRARSGGPGDTCA